MTEHDKPHFSELLTGTSDYYRVPLSEFTLNLYWNGLRRFDIAAIEKALERHICRADKDGEFMPKVGALTVMLEGSTGDQSAVASRPATSVAQ